MVLGYDNPWPLPQGSFKFPVVPPGVDPDDGDSAVICFSKAWLPYVLGAVQQLTLQATWSGDEATVKLTLDRAMELLYLMAQPLPTCPDILVVKGLRYNPDDDLIEQTFDDGLTWQPAPGFDPRHNPIFQYPVVVADDPQCQAAANIARFIENFIETTLNNLALGSDAIGLALVFLPLVVTLGPFAILFDLILALAVGLVALGATVIGAAFTPEVIDQLRCIFYCHIDMDGRLTVGSLEAINADIAADIGTPVSEVTSAMFFLMGEVGLGNAGTFNSGAPADCDDCACAWAAVDSFCGGVSGIWSVVFGTTTADGIQAVNAGGWPSVTRVDGTLVVPSGTTITALRAYNNTQGSINNSLYILQDGVIVINGVPIGDELLGLTGISLGPGTYDFIVQVTNGTTGVIDTLAGIYWEGFGDNPFATTDDPPPCWPF